ncbi:MAG: hypothetical protein LKE40_13210 [Spirochaetia bacterium]|nr:hypothetical protein [Spirochaetia bacterium]
MAENGNRECREVRRIDYSGCGMIGWQESANEKGRWNTGTAVYLVVLPYGTGSKVNDRCLAIPDCSIQGINALVLFFCCTAIYNMTPDTSLPV